MTDNEFKFEMIVLFMDVYWVIDFNVPAVNLATICLSYSRFHTRAVKQIISKHEQTCW